MAPSSSRRTTRATGTPDHPHHAGARDPRARDQPSRQVGLALGQHDHVLGPHSHGALPDREIRRVARNHEDPASLRQPGHLDCPGRGWNGDSPH